MHRNQAGASTLRARALQDGRIGRSSDASSCRRVPFGVVDHLSAQVGEVQGLVNRLDPGAKVAMGFLVLIVAVVAIGATVFGVWVARSTGEVHSVRSYEKAVQALSGLAEERHLVSSSAPSHHAHVLTPLDSDEDGDDLYGLDSHVHGAPEDISNLRLISRVVGSDVVVSYGTQQQLRAKELSRAPIGSTQLRPGISRQLDGRTRSEHTEDRLALDPKSPVSEDTAGLPRHAHAQFASGAESNTRLTSVVGLLLAVLLFFEGITVAFITQLLAWHIIIGLIIIPPLALKLGSVLWRFTHYYLGDQRYRRAGPPAPLLRALGPPLFILTVILMISGVALWLGGPKDHTMFVIHQVTFFAWIFLIAVHVIGHLGQAVRLGVADSGFTGRVADTVRGGGKRIAVAALSLVLGLGIGFYGKAITNNWGRVPTPVHAHAARSARAGSTNASSATGSTTGSATLPTK
ncbi:MAG: hypothetical protein ACYDEP_14040 [Acidimicrobiales bacterium]